MKEPREHWAALLWRLRATRRLWSLGVTPNMSFLPPGPLGPGSHGVLDEPSVGAELDENTLYARGWTLFPSGPPTKVELWLGDQSLGRARIGLPRPDIEKRTGDSLAGVCGFELTADLTELELPPGPITLRATATSAEGDRHELPRVAVTVAAGDEDDDSTMPPPPTRTPHSAGGDSCPRILVCTHQLNLGGAQLYLLDLLRELVRQDAAEPTVVSSLDGVLREDLEELGIPVHISSLVPLEDLSSHIGRVEELAVWAEGRGFDVAFVNTATAHAFPGAEAAAVLGVPTIWAIHESFPPAVLWSNLSPEIRDRAKGALAGAELALFEADSTRRLFEPPLREGHGLVAPYGLDLEPIDKARAGFDRGELRREAGIAEDAEVVLCVGTVEPRKAQLPLAQAFGSISARHPKAKLVFVGCRDDADSDALSNFIEASGHDDTIDLIPVTPDVEPWYGMADLLVCASDIESLPRTVLEAMAYETPVLATDVFGLPELIDDGETGWLCESRDALALAKALDRALSSTPEERRRIGQAGRQLVEKRHSLEAYGRQVGGLLSQVAAGKGLDATAHATAK